MKAPLTKALFLLTIPLCCLYFSCGPATHVSVGVGVYGPGPWTGYPYPGGTSIWVGRPVHGQPYYPANPDTLSNRQFVQIPEKPPETAAETMETINHKNHANSPETLLQ